MIGVAKAMKYLRFPLVCAIAAAALSQTPPPSGAAPPQTAPAQTAPTQVAPAPAAPAIPSQQAQPIAANAPEMTTKEAPAIFKTRVDMVSVPVVVRDPKGKIAGNLTKENFAVFDRGKPQEIVRFSVEKAGDLAAKAAETADAPPLEGGDKMPDIPERFLAYLFDDTHLAFGDLTRARNAAAHQIEKMAKTDRAAIYTTSGQNQLEFTDDVDKLQDTLASLRPRGMAVTSLTDCVQISYYLADLIINKNDPMALSAVSNEEIACLG